MKNSKFVTLAYLTVLQREDWRQRPLSEEMVEYAQTDAHFLLYIADSLIAELKEQVVGMPSIVFTFMIDTFIIYLLISYILIYRMKIVSVPQNCNHIVRL